jgi:hypothetical protein
MGYNHEILRQHPVLCSLEINVYFLFVLTSVIDCYTRSLTPATKFGLTGVDSIGIDDIIFI